MAIQIIITLVSLFIILKAITKLQKKEVHAQTFIVWALFWFGVIVLIWQPHLTDYLARFLQVTRGADAVFYLSLVIIFYMFFKLFIRLERIEQDITTLVREIALLRKNREDK